MAAPTIFVYTAANTGLSPSGFVALVVPVNCSCYLLKNAGPDTLYMRSNPANANTEDSMPAGFYEDCLMNQNDGFERFASGSILYYVKCTGPLIAKFFW